MDRRREMAELAMQLDSSQPIMQDDPTFAANDVCAAALAGVDHVLLTAEALFAATEICRYKRSVHVGVGTWNNNGPPRRDSLHI